MDTSGIANDTMLGAAMMKTALKMQQQTAAQLLESVPAPASSGSVASPPDPSSRIGQNIDVKA